MTKTAENIGGTFMGLIGKIRKARAMKRFILCISGWLIVTFIGGVPCLRAAGLLERIKDQEISQTLRLKAGQSKVLRTPFPITRISVGNPGVADVLVISQKEVYITGLEAGYTNINVWGDRGRLTSATVLVELDVAMLKEKLHQLLPTEKIAVYPNGKSVVLTGEVSSPVAQQTAVQLAEAFLGIKSGGGGAVEDPKASQTSMMSVMGGAEKGGVSQSTGGSPEKGRVINLLHVGGVQQVMVAVRIAEINRDIGRQIGVNFSGISQTGNFGVSLLDNLTSITNLQRGFNSTSFNVGISNAINAIAGWKAGGILWTAFFSALKREGLGRILAEPNLVATSGQEASFLAGGEFPVPVPQDFGVITIEYKKFGVGLTFTPTVLDSGKIGLKVMPEVSELDETIAPVVIAGLQIPGLRVRRTSTSVEVKDGQTFAIAGLLGDQYRTIINKFPVLGDIPILGAVFRSSRFQKNETELVVLVTPYLVKPMETKQARLPTDSYIEANDFEFYLLGALEGRPNRRPPAPRDNLPAGFGSQRVQ